jgi:hypothetical protein
MFRIPSSFHLQVQLKQGDSASELVCIKQILRVSLSGPNTFVYLASQKSQRIHQRNQVIFCRKDNK